MGAHELESAEGDKSGRQKKKERERLGGALTDCGAAEEIKSAHRKRASEGRSRPVEYGEDE
jgi:hypothetical protein